MSFRQFILDSTGRATLTTQAIADSPGAASIAGQAYMTSGEAAFATTDSVAASDVFNGGFRYTATGILRISDTTAGLPASTSINQGIAMTDDGQVCITTEDNTSPAEDYHLAGVALTDDSRIYVNLLSFMLPLDDLGSGEVDLVLKLGQGDPTFTRATTATTVNSVGTIISVASGTARSWYDPTTLEYGGYLEEGARTNLCLQSEDLDTAAAWNWRLLTVSADQTVSPDGATSADKLEEDNTAGTHEIQPDGNFTISAGSSVTASLFVKADKRTEILIDIREGANATGYTCIFDLADGTADIPAAVGSPTGSATATIKEYPNGWYRCSLAISQIDAASTEVLMRFKLVKAGTEIYTGITGEGLFAWGSQFEDASFASSYIPTTTAAVARNADVLTYQFAGNASATAGTAYAEVMVEHPGTLATDTVAVAFSNASSIGTLRAGNVANTVINIRDGTQTVSKSGLTDMQTAIRKRASAWGGSTMAITGDGATVASGSFDGDLGSIAIAIGCDSAGGRTWFGTIKNVRIWTSQLPNGELQVITT